MADFQDGPIIAPLRALPPVQRLLEAAEAGGLLAEHGRARFTAALRRELAMLRQAIVGGDPAAPPDEPALLKRAAARLRRDAVPRLRRAVNATGIVLHTNLGRAPLAPEAIAAMEEAASAACNLEFDLETGRRGVRAGGALALLRRLTGAEAALAVNNNAAAMLLALTGLAAGGEVIVSRGELVEIGGGFRIPDIIASGGARLVEVGTTNKTRLADYEAAITPASRVLLKVHQSNFRILGFTSDVALAALSRLARARGLVLVHDLGGGTINPLPRGLADAEPTVRASIEAGSDLVAFSGDKLLGGPQSGLLAGRAPIVASLARHPLMRALRLDKMSLAALEATLHLHTDPDMAQARIPVLRALAQSPALVLARAETLAAALAPHCTAEVVPSTGHAGGGALPGMELPSHAVRLALPGLSADRFAGVLRTSTPAIVGRVHEGALLLDMLTVTEPELPQIVQAVREAAFCLA